jgi:cell division septation protein DedD
MSPTGTPRLAVALGCLVALAIVVAPAGAVEEPRDAPEDTSPPVVVYVGEEELNVSQVELTGGGTVGTEPTQFVGVAGDADGVPLSIGDPTAADFDDVETGAYDSEADADERAEFVVTRPEVTDLELRSERGVNVTGDTVDDLDTITVEAEYDFAEADRLDVTVESPDGIDLTPRGRITESPGSFTVDVRGERTGTFRVTVEGSELEDATRTVTVTLQPDGGGAATVTATETAAATTTGADTPTASPTATEAPPTATPPPTDSPTATARPTTATGSPTPTPRATTATSAPGGGFGVAVAVAALATLAVVAARSGRR